MKIGELSELNLSEGDLVLWHKAAEGYEYMNFRQEGVLYKVKSREGEHFLKSINKQRSNHWSWGCTHKFRVMFRQKDSVISEEFQEELVKALKRGWEDANHRTP